MANIIDIYDEVKKFREKYKISDDIPVDLKKICKDLNITIKICSMVNVESNVGAKISGMIKYDKIKQSGTIFVNDEDIPTRQTFTIAHELGHYHLHIPTDDNGLVVSFRGITTPKEIEADKFAAELLMPKDKVIEEHSKLFYPTVSSLSKSFGVSNLAMKIRLNELGLNFIG